MSDVSVFHTYLTILIPAIVAFVITLIATKFIIGYMREAGITITDHNKADKRKLPSGGGIAVAFGFTIGLLAYIFGSSFNLYSPVVHLYELFAVLTAVLLITVSGFLDELVFRGDVQKLTVTKDRKDTKRGLRQWQRPLLTLVGALPFMAINAGVSTIELPFIGQVSFGLFYPLLIIPLAVIFVSNSFNLLGGFDGIASGSALVLSGAMLLYGILFSSYIGALLSGVLFATVLAFFLFNVYPAKIIPGDSFTFGVGAALLGIMVLGNMEAFGVIIFLPFFVEFFLHLRKKFKVTDLGKLQPDGTLASQYGKKVYSWTHLIMNMKRCKEWEVSLYMWLIEIGFVALAFGLKFLNLL
ncbi:MAG: hypothetical protein M1158_04095 [Candidatus Marsarchaeota archaeon]|nr:hypothetical protein [Candidatus Marsarchaeota archaeon]